MSRGAIISMFTVLLVLPAMYMIFDKIIIKTTLGVNPSVQSQEKITDCVNKIA